MGKYFDTNAPIKTSPFCTYYEICTDIQLTDPYCTEDGSRHIAWASVQRRLPKSLQTLVSTFRIIMYPTPEQWYDINSAYLAHVRSQTRNNAPDQLMAAVVHVQPQETVKQTNVNNQNNPAPPAYSNGPKPPAANNAERPPMKDIFPSRKNLCWYHQKFGKKAKQCGKDPEGNKCAWTVNLPPRDPRPNNANNNNRTAQLSAVTNKSDFQREELASTSTDPSGSSNVFFENQGN